MDLMTHTFIKENGIWYIDLPEFLESGMGTKANLMMVAGADTLLDRLSNHGDQISITISEKPFEVYEDVLNKTRMGLDKSYLDQVGHAPVEYGAYYHARNMDHDLWLCPVTEYVFEGMYPDKIYIALSS